MSSTALDLDSTRLASTPAWFRGRAHAAWQEYQKMPLPGLKDEAWRYSNARRIALDTLKKAAAPTTEAREEVIARSIGLPMAAATFVFINDVLVHSHAKSLPQGVIAVPLDVALREHGEVVKKHFMQREMELGSAKFAALHLSQVKAGVVFIVPEGVTVPHPVEVFHWAAGEGAAIFPHTLIIAGEGASLTVVDHYRSAQDEAGLSCAIADLVGEAGSRVTYVACQEMGARAQAMHLSSTTAGKDAQMKNFQLQLGAEFSRSESVSDLIGAGSRSDMLSVSLPLGEQVVDQRTLQKHKAPHASSDLLYKNALYDRSRTIFSGLITVDEGAHHTDAYQTCRNLLNSDEAEASSMPGLEINADQVKCSHGSTSAPVSDEELFYLKARGINDADSRRLIVLGFINDAIARIGDEAIETMIRARLEEKFASLS
jgi:Fe-S cluster assembly protein SufD